MIIIIGDSNYRNTMEVHSAALSSALKNEEVQFKFVTSTESLKLSLGAEAGTPAIIVIGAPINQLAASIEKNPKKGKDETLRSIVTEHIRVINESATLRPNTMHLIMPPFLRQDPAWMEQKLALMLFYSKDNITKTSTWNTVLGSSAALEASDLEEDKVHLNGNGMKKLFGVIKGDITKIKDHMEDEDEDMEALDWASQFSNVIEPPTPSTIRKRNREAEPEEEDEGDTRKKAKVDSLLEKMEAFIVEMRKDRGEEKVKIADIEEQVTKTIENVDEVRGQVDSLMKKSKSEVTLTAEMREDIDSLENENLKSTVIIRKLPTTEPVPKERKLLRAFVSRAAKEMVEDILDEDAGKQIKFVATLYLTVDPKKKDNAAGLVPPFKIGFRTKDMGVRFREEAVKAAKQEGNKYASTYFTHCQSSATRIRSQLMWAVVDAIKPNHDEVWVSQGTRPMLQIKKGERIVGSYNFVKTMMLYKDKIPKKKLDETRKVATKFFYGKLEKTFIVFKD